MITKKELTLTKHIKYYYLCLEVNKKEVKISLSFDVDDNIYIEDWEFLQNYNLTKKEIDEIDDFIRNLSLNDLNF